MLIGRTRKRAVNFANLYRWLQILSERSRSGRVVVKMDQPPLQKEVSETEALLESGSISSRGADASPSSTSSSASSKYLRTAAKVSVGCLAVAGVVMLGATRSNAANKENLAALAASSGESDIHNLKLHL